MQMQKLGKKKLQGFYSILAKFKDFQGLENEAIFFKEFQGCGNPAVFPPWAIFYFK